MRIHFKTKVPVNYKTIKAGFTQELFLYLSPPWVKTDLIKFDGCATGDEVHIQIKRPPLVLSWVSLITHDELTDTEWSFVDEGKKLPWPLTSWRHHHRVQRVSESESVIVDDIRFGCKNRLTELLFYPSLWATFAIRPMRYKAFFKEQA